MELIFFDAKPKGKEPAPPAVTVRPKGAISLNTAAVATLNAEAGEAAALAYDSAGQRWVLCHWPNGCEGKPELRALTGKNGTAGLRFACLPAASVFFAQLPAAQQALTSLSCPLNAELIQEAKYPGINFYVLTLPASTNAAPQASAPAQAKTAPITKQPGVGRGRYARAGQAQKGAVSRG